MFCFCVAEHLMNYGLEVRVRLIGGPGSGFFFWYLGSAVTILSTTNTWVAGTQAAVKDFYKYINGTATIVVQMS